MPTGCMLTGATVYGEEEEEEEEEQATAAGRTAPGARGLNAAT